jgi:hypothetical protein
MSIAQKKRTARIRLNRSSNGMLMTPEEFDEPGALETSGILGDIANLSSLVWSYFGVAGCEQP